MVQWGSMVHSTELLLVRPQRRSVELLRLIGSPLPGSGAAKMKYTLYPLPNPRRLDRVAVARFQYQIYV